MNPLKSPLHRTATVLAGALIGVTGAAVFAAPASAHHPELAGKTVCLTDGGWKVDWTLTPIAPIPGTITKVNGVPASTLTKIAAGTPVPVNTPITDTQAFTEDDASATLTVEVTWIPEPRKFDKLKNSDGGYNTEPKPIVKDVTATVPRPADCKQPTTPPTTTPPVTTPPATTPPATTPPVTTPPATTPPTTPPATPTPTPTFGEAQPIFDLTCDSMTIGLDNPADGVEIPLVLVPSTGEKTTLVIKPGEKKSKTFEAGEGFSVTIALEGFEDEGEKIDWESPGDCDGEGAGGELPLTGVAVGGIAGGAALLLAIGAGLFVMTRRRNVKFTA